MIATETTSNKKNWFYGLGCLFLLPLTIYLQYQYGYSLGYEGAVLAGYSTGAMMWVLVVLGITALFKKARNPLSLLRAAFFTLIFLSFLSSQGLLRTESEMATLSTAVDPASYEIDAQQAEMLGKQIEAAVQQGNTKEVAQFMNTRRLMRKALTGQTVTPRLRDYAQGFARGLQDMSVFEQFSAQVKSGGTFQFAKYFHKNGRPFLQFRLVNSLGGLSYLGMYLYKNDNGKPGIEDLLIYETGASIAEQAVAQAPTTRDERAEKPEEIKQKTQELRQLVQQRKFAEAIQFIETLPPYLQRLKALQQAKIQFMFEVDPAKADGLLTEYRKTYPQDLSIIFLSFDARVAKNELTLASKLVDEVYQAVDQDEYFLWHTARLFATAPDPLETMKLLTKMEAQYKINVRQMASHYLPATFLSSKEYKLWASRPLAPEMIESAKKMIA